MMAPGTSTLMWSVSSGGTARMASSIAA